MRYDFIVDREGNMFRGNYVVRDERGREVMAGPGPWIHHTEARPFPFRAAPNHDGISDGFPSSTFNVDGLAIVTRDASTCYVDVKIADGSFVASGSAKRNKGEEFDFEIGANLAIGRALINAGREFERRAMGKIKEADRNENQSQLIDKLHDRQKSWGQTWAEVLATLAKTTEGTEGAKVRYIPEGRSEIFDLPPGSLNIVGPIDPYPHDPEGPPTLEDLEREEAREVWRAGIDRNDPDAEGNWPTDDNEKRLSLYDRIKELWR